MYGQTDGWKDGWTDSPCVLQDFIAFGVSAQKHPSSAYFVNERLLLSGHLHEMPDSVQLLLRDVIYLRCHRSYILDVIYLKDLIKIGEVVKILQVFEIKT